VPITYSYLVIRQFTDTTMTTTSCGIIKDENGLILPRKIANPCIESPCRRDLHREIKWNSNKGINVLNSKTELEKAFAKHKKSLEKKRKEQEQDEKKTKKMIAERAKRLEKQEKPEEELTESKQLKCKTISSHCQNQIPSKFKAAPPNQTKSPLKKPIRVNSSGTKVTSGGGNNENLESEFSRVFNQLRRDKHELVV